MPYIVAIIVVILVPSLLLLAAVTAVEMAKTIGMGLVIIIAVVAAVVFARWIRTMIGSLFGPKKQRYGECPECMKRVRLGAKECAFCGEKLKWVEDDGK